METIQKIHLFPNGSVEVGTASPYTRPGYRWTPAYSEKTENGFSNPLTRRHWQQIAQRDNVKLVFHPDAKAASEAMQLERQTIVLTSRGE